MTTEPATSPGGMERAAVGTLLLLLTAFPLLPRVGLYVCSGATLVVTSLALWRRWRHASRLGLFLCLALGGFVAGALSQVVLGGATLVYLVLARFVPQLSGAGRWARAGSIDRTTVWLSIAFTVTAATALLLWHEVVRPDLRDLYETFVPEVSPWLLVVGAVLFASINAAVEEAAYRGVVQDALEGVVSAPLAVSGQAIAFGALHIHGFPRGVLGVALASVYGVMMGVVRHRSRGLLAPWIAHVFTDLAIVSILLFLAR